MALFKDKDVKDVERRLRDVEKREAIVAEREDLLRKETDEANRRLQEIEAKRSDLARRDRDVVESEMKAKMGFVEQNNEALKNFQAFLASVDDRETRLRDEEQRLTARCQTAVEREAVLADRERTVKVRELKADAGFAEQNLLSLREVERRQAAVEAFESRMRALDEALSTREACVAQKDGALAERERAVREREAIADAGFAERNRTALGVLDTQHSGLVAQLAELNAQLADTRRVRLQAIEKELSEEEAWRRHALDEELQQTRAHFDTMMQQSRTALSACETEHADLLNEINSLRERMAQTRAQGIAALEKELTEEAQQRRQALAEELRHTQSHIEAVAKQGCDALIAVKKDHDHLLTQIATLNTEFAQSRLSAIESLHAEFTTEAEERRRALAAEITETRAHATEVLQHECEQRRNDTTNECNAVREAAQSLQTQLAEREAALGRQSKELQELRVALDRKEMDATAEKQLAEEDRRQLDRRVNDRVESATKDIQWKCNEQGRRIEELCAECSGLEEQLTRMRESERRFGDQSPEEVLRQRKELEADLQRVRDELEKRPTLAAKERLDTQVAELSALQREREDLFQELVQLRAKQNQWTLSVKELEQQRDVREMAERCRDVLVAERETLETEMDALRAEVARLRSLYERPQDVKIRTEAIERPLASLAALPRADGDCELTEIAWLAQINDDCDKSGYVFNKRLLYAFHTALKTAAWSPLAVLAGVSGTGKSALPEKYARFGGLAYQPLSVQPNWDSPQSLFGFFNSIDNKFNATELVRAMVQSQRDPDDPECEGGLRDRLLLVLLDEMNLSHVELYFSDLLSKLESRRDKSDSEEEYVAIDQGAGSDKYQLLLGRNILWAGTMNEDETTKTLSDKVLDRSNIIIFPRPTHLKSRAKPHQEPQRALLARATWESWTRKESELTEEQTKPFRELLEEMNRHLGLVGRALGHRVWQSAEHYMANYPTVIDAKEKSDEAALDKELKVAFEDQVVQRVMPKLRGIETSDNARNVCLDPIKVLLKNFGLHLEDDFNLACKGGYGGFLWKSAIYLEDAQ